MLKLKMAASKVCCGPLILVNQQHPLPVEAAELFIDKCGEELVQVEPDQPQLLLQRMAACQLRRLLQHLQACSQIKPISGWRSRTEQQQIYSSSLAEHGEAFTRQYVALPGCSEHETGLAVDMALVLPQIDYLTPAFPYEGICQSFRNAAASYGFIERYPQGKEGVTGIGHEPWHFRYVGQPHATLISRQGLTLEEYLDDLHQATQGGKVFTSHEDGQAVRVSYTEAANEDDVILQLAGNAPYSISGDNLGGFIVTEWEE